MTRVYFGPQNRPAWERGQHIRALIRAYLLDQSRLHPFSRRPTWREIQAHLRTRSYYLERSTILHHVQQLELSEIERHAADVPNTGEAA